MAIHERYEPDRWQSQRDEYKDRWFDPTAEPGALCALLAQRQMLERSRDLGRRVPTDIFTFFPGEPQDRSVTKIGGLPYRPAAMPWPRGHLSYEDDVELRSKEEWLTILDLAPEFSAEEDEWLNDMYRPLHFLAQFNFADSRDLTGELPGDVLLLFGDPQSTPFITYYEWHNLGIEELVLSEQIPALYLEFGPREPPPCYGQIFRTCDYPDAESAERDHYQLFQWEATRIGGVPFSAQLIAEHLPGRHLCTLHGLASSDVNIFVNIDEDGRLHWIDECT